MDLKQIKARRAGLGATEWSTLAASFPDVEILTASDSKTDENTLVFRGENRKGVANFVSNAPYDVDALVAEVERLDREVELCEVGLTPSDVDEAPDDLQHCGHPQNAIVSADDLGGPGTQYCGMCVKEGKALTALEPGWKLPDAPKCEHGETAIPAVHWTGAFWTWGWNTDCCGPDPFNWGDDGEHGMLGDKIDWPFVGSFASGKDWKLAGFEER